MTNKVVITHNNRNCNTYSYSSSRRDLTKSVPKDHHSDCYFGMTNICEYSTKNKSKMVYPIVTTALNTTNELEPVRTVNAKEFIRLDQSFSITSSENQNNNNIELIMYWQLDWIEKKAFVLNCLSRTDVMRRTTETEFSQRKNTFKYFLTNKTGEKMLVCKCFFLTTLGYHRKNDWSSICKTECFIDTYIENFNPSVSHYRREHAPERRYLPSDLTIESMYKNYLETCPHNQCSNEVYRKRLKHKNISFTNLGHEECELCEGFKLHNKQHNPENLDQACTDCNSWKEHIQRANDSRASYRLDTTEEDSPTTLKVSVDLQKVIMLPRLDMFKKVIFTQRISVFNESFVPLKIISSFNAFFLHYRDIKHYVLWVDNCSEQNKNWTLLSFLVYIVNSDAIAAVDICITCFEPGHTFMSADSFHYQVELSLKKQKRTYDFDDFVTAVKKANSKKVEAKTMQCTAFFKWQDFSSQTKIKNIDPRRYLAKITQIVANRGFFSLKYKLTNNSDNIHEMDVLQNKILKKTLPSFNVFTSPCGVPRTKKEALLKNLKPIILSNRLQF
ncbi:hypothetical protein RN001_011812 [Aquatica leii]|uniref:DUF7869 domain-containing protein n=1 Tax=Aquatica leii TaxID=1421715 RepID=A0AAN7Q138_9COLE|nr:hypothetical protein RN001_011812 [Aquatica leii]